MHEVQKKYEAEINELVCAAVRVAEDGFVTSHGGNLSYRINENTIAITPTKVPKGCVTFDDVCVIDPRGTVLYAAEGRKPTGEWPFHVGIMNDRPDVRGVVHAHPPIVTGFAIARSDLLARPHLPEPIMEIGPVLQVAYEEPLSDELAAAFKPVIKRSNAFLMLNHGVLLVSPEGIGRAVELLEMLEATAQSLTVAQAAGEIHELGKNDVQKLDNVNRTRGLPFPGLPGEVDSLTELYFD